MSVPSALRFRWAQSASAYRAVHDEVVRLAGPAAGRTWLDVGCGPGGLAQLAATQGFVALGVDRDRSAIRLARRDPAGWGAAGAVRFAVGDADGDLPGADVVSAASLLGQLADPRVSLLHLWDAVRPGGLLLVVEPTETMTAAAMRAAVPEADRRSRRVIRKWSRARGGRGVPVGVFDGLEGERRDVLLLGGCLRAVLVSRR